MGSWRHRGASVIAVLGILALMVSEAGHQTPALTTITDATIALTGQFDTDTKEPVVASPAAIEPDVASAAGIQPVMGADTGIRDVLIGMIENRQTTAEDIESYLIKDEEVYAIFRDVLANECMVIAQAEPGLSLSMTCDEERYAKTIFLSNFAGETNERQLQLDEAVETAMTYISDGMTEVEKALILHDLLIDCVEYHYDEQDPGITSYHILMDGEGLCAGYTQALQLLYQTAGLDSIVVYGNDAYHAWLLVQLDGQYYHVDPTWDDLQSYYRHYYFLRSDAQYENPEKGDAHFHWSAEETVPVAGTAYDDWFIHDAVGKVVYYKGYWYYSSGYALKKARIDGSGMQTIFSGDKKVTIVSSDASGVRYCLEE